MIYRLYDVGYEIDLERALDLLAHSPRERERLRRTLQHEADSAGAVHEEEEGLAARRSARAEAQAIRIQNPPITSPLGVDSIALGDRQHPVHVSARIFDFGVISLRLSIETPGVLSWPDFTAFGNAVDAAGVVALFERHIQLLTDHIAATIARPQLAPVTEDYIVYRVTRLLGSNGEALPSAVVRQLDVVPLLLNEQRSLADEARKELLPYWFSYYPDDLAVLAWNSALIIDPAEGDSDVQLILEFANAQLLELRYYDALLDAELPRMYDRIAESRAGGRALLGRGYVPLLTALQTLVADSTEIVERAENALKVTDDVYLARVYAAALELFRGRAWRAGIDHKLAIIRQTYAMLNAESMARRNEILEVAIVLLIVLEIVIAVVRP